MDAWANLIRAVAELVRALQWPLVALIVVLFFRVEVRTLLGRIRRGKMLGAELELDEALSRLEASAELKSQVPSSHAPATIPPVDEAGQALGKDKKVEDELDGDRFETELDKEREIFRTASLSPRAALMLLSSEIEATMRQIAAILNLHSKYGKTYRSMSVVEIARLLAIDNVIPPHFADFVKDFWSVRNIVAHGGEESEDSIFRGMDVGFDLMRYFKAVLERLLRDADRNPGDADENH